MSHILFDVLHVFCRTSVWVSYMCYVAHVFWCIACVMSHIFLCVLYVLYHVSLWMYYMCHVTHRFSFHTHWHTSFSYVANLSKCGMSHICLPTSHIFFDVTLVLCHTSFLMCYMCDIAPILWCVTRFMSHIFLDVSCRTACHIFFAVVHVLFHTSSLMHHMCDVAHHASVFLPYTLAHIYLPMSHIFHDVLCCTYFVIYYVAHISWCVTWVMSHIILSSLHTGAHLSSDVTHLEVLSHTSFFLHRTSLCMWYIYYVTHLSWYCKCVMSHIFLGVVNILCHTSFLVW